MNKRLRIPADFIVWFEETFGDDSHIHVHGGWKGVSECKQIGVIHPELETFRFVTSDLKTILETDGHAERPARMFAKALTRAGWLRPYLDPESLIQLVQLRAGGNSCKRVEFILDTNAMVEGIAHWLVDVFADRCDLVLTAVTLRELQDQVSIAQMGKEITPNTNNNKKLGARQLYLAASRFRETVGYSRVLWRELELDDTALLLSRGSSAEPAKKSESDTLLLRGVRRSINDGVRGLDRFFVTGDTALARRAATELPDGTIIAAQVQEIHDGGVYFPCRWWPGPDQGQSVDRHPARILWEFLSIADFLEIESYGSKWRLRAFENPMWPSDYLNPWVSIEEISSYDGDRDTLDGGDKTEVKNEDLTSNTMVVSQQGEASIVPETRSEIWQRAPEDVPTLDRNLRVPGSTILNVLGRLATHRDANGLSEVMGKEPRVQREIRTLLANLELAELDSNGDQFQPKAKFDHLVEAWKANDHDALFDLLQGWTPVKDWALSEYPCQRSGKTDSAARALAELLAQGMYLDAGVWSRGGKRPSVQEIRDAVITAIPHRSPRAITIYDLLVHVFLRRLGVHPYRVMVKWDRLQEAGVFDGFEFRKGGSSTNRNIIQVAQFGPAGWTKKSVDLESFRGYRDLLYREFHHD